MGLAGCCITASHNPKNDNGVKIIDADGSMLHPDWEPLAEQIVNAPSLLDFLLDLDRPDNRSKYGFEASIFDPVLTAQASFAMDTRESSPVLMKHMLSGVSALGVKYVNFGLCTTPQLHWLIHQKKTHASEARLYAKHCKDKFLSFLEECDKNIDETTPLISKKNYEPELILDCANGIGSYVMNEIIHDKDFARRLKITFINDDKSPTNLNLNCGADHLKNGNFPSNSSVY